MTLIALKSVSHTFGGPKLLDEADFSIARGDRVCLLGRNGEGKSTLLKIVVGDLKPDEGEIVRAQGLKVAQLPQDVPPGLTGSVADVVATGCDPAIHEPHEVEHLVETILSRLDLDGSTLFETLSSGLKRRVLLARSLVGEPDLLLLDEPTNHLDIDAIDKLEEYLTRFGGAVLFVTHDRAFLERLASRIVELDRGKLHSWDCDYRTFLLRREQQWAAEERQQALFDKKLAQEEAWIRQGIKARRTRNEGRVRALKSLREERAKRRERQGTARIEIQEGDKSGAMVIEVRGVSFGYDASKPIVRDLETTIFRGDKVAIIGPNGRGKTTLLKLLLGRMAPQSGTIRHGTNLQIAYFDQVKEMLDDEKTVQKNVSEYEAIRVNGQERHVIGYLQDFLFTPDRARSLVKYLSGGERSRLLLARLFTQPANLLVLDEPTNDLDLETLELLESLIVDFSGTVLVVSHDRAFVDEVATSTLVIEDDGRVKEYDGGYTDYLRQRPAPVETPKPAAKADKPAVAVATSAPDATPKRRKLSNKEQRELETLPGLIETLEAELADLEATMADPSFYKRDKAEIGETAARAESIRGKLAESYARWEELES
ncbi:ATP-binding cassette domain-containing protein [bacterium]|nr:ATP-binding cassette domain-containing protein [bacterium]